MSRTVARLLAESLEAYDIDQVYCVPGESYVGLTSALIERNSIRVIVCRYANAPASPWSRAGRVCRTARWRCTRPITTPHRW
jgi:acetolactate synthase-1/2/3 large subunit